MILEKFHHLFNIRLFEGNQYESGFYNLYGILIDPETGSY